MPKAQPPFSESNEEANGQVPSVKDGVQPAPGAQESPNIDLAQYKEIINEKLIDEIQDKITQIDPAIFQGVVAELAELMESFKGNLAQLQVLQFTSPDAYNNILAIFQTLTTLAQIMLMNGDLPSDSDVVSQANAQQIQQVAGQQASSGPADDENDGPDGRGVVPIGTIKYVRVGNVMRARRKESDGWHYVSSGIGGSPGRPSGG